MSEPVPSETIEPEREAARGAVRPRRTSPRRLLADKAAAWVVRAGGFAIIAGILGILLFILAEVFPLAAPAEVETARSGPLPGSVAALLSDEHRTHVAATGLDGRLRVVDPADGRALLDVPWIGSEEGTPLPFRSVAAVPGASAFSANLGDGRAAHLPVRWSVAFEEDRRVVTAEADAPIVLTLDPSGAPLGAVTTRVRPDGSVFAAAQVADGRIVVALRTREENAMTGEVTEVETRHEFPDPGSLSSLLLDGEGRNLFGGDRRGGLHWWQVSAEGAGPAHATTPTGSPVTALTLLLGDRSVVAGHEDGRIDVWFLVRDGGGFRHLEESRSFPPHGAAVRALAPSQRGKGFVALDDDGTLGLYYSTSERVLWTGVSGVERAAAVAYAPKGDGAFVVGGGRLVEHAIDNPHPEVSWRALFGKVWYEGYEKPEHVWQSTGGTDDFEPKISLTPLLFGTLKGTFFSMLLAIPLGVLAAVYASQFMHPNLKRIVKPTVEIMAALPSVVLGFLAGLWLAPRVETVFPALLLMGIVLPLTVLLAGWGWGAVPRALRGRFPEGTETVCFALAIVLGAAACIAFHEPFAASAFAGDFQTWLFETSGMRYDQRNAVVVGLAMGFAVIPIIFAIAEDALSNVPRNLTSGALALGATNWQTVARIVIPTASPGIFAAVMVGFGRAVGETMIVLMATGNTPIMDWSPFNGFRTLSANIAVEIPEAPHGGTLYRTLFLAALLLFLMTFVVNTAAELVRQRLRNKYSNL
jgi:phosphate transport system permease protein